MERHAQRQHIVASLDSLLYQLLTLSFFAAPAFLPFIARLGAQAHCTPRPHLSSLRFRLALLLILNGPSIWLHAARAPHDHAPILLDFVGLAHPLSRFHLLVLDAFILFLQSLLATIAYESALALNSSEPDFLCHSKDLDSHYIIDIRLMSLLSHLRNPPPAHTNASLPLPNTTSWSLPTGFGMALLRAGRRIGTGAQDRRIPGALDPQSDQPST